MDIANIPGKTMSVTWRINIISCKAITKKKNVHAYIDIMHVPIIELIL